MASLPKLLRRAFLVTPLKLAERALLLRDWAGTQPKLFILGLPRSGTTLVYQYIVHRLRVAYFTSGVGRFPRSPCMITRRELRRHGEYASDFQSNYGTVAGPAAPHEAGGVWARWFGYEDYVRFTDLDARAVAQMKATVGCVQRAFGDAPFVNKNVKHMLRIDALGQVFPDATFLVVSRNMQDVALSVLRARSANGGDPARWWSARPPDYEAIKALPPAQQVARQLHSLERRMEEDLGALPAGRVLRIDYEKFCGNPDSLVQLLRKVWGDVPCRNETVARFETNLNQPRTDEERELIRLLADMGKCSP